MLGNTWLLNVAMTDIVVVDGLHIIQTRPMLVSSCILVLHRVFHAGATGISAKRNFHLLAYKLSHPTLLWTTSSCVVVVSPGNIVLHLRFGL